jgi:hypothetical protein
MIAILNCEKDFDDAFDALVGCFSCSLDLLGILAFKLRNGIDLFL